MEDNINTSKIRSSSFVSTIETLQKIGGLLTRIKSYYLPHEKNSEEHSLKINGKGLTTTLILVEVGNKRSTLEISVDFYSHSLRLIMEDKKGEINFLGSTFNMITNQLIDFINDDQIKGIIDSEIIPGNQELHYVKDDAILVWKIISTLYFVFLEFKSSIIEETSNINFWPHHFDIAMLLFSGKIIKGENHQNWSYSREQMNFGFLFGDDSISAPYFYITMYPFEKSALKYELNNGAYWHTKNWNGAILELTNDHLVDLSIVHDFFYEVRNLIINKLYNEDNK